jgi:hypothetical protein
MKSSPAHSSGTTLTNEQYNAIYGPPVYDTVLYCLTCETSDFQGRTPTKRTESTYNQQTEKSYYRDYSICPLCDEHLVERRTGFKGGRKSDTEEPSVRKHQYKEDSRRPNTDSVVREWVSSLGKVRIHLSRHSYFAPMVFLAGKESPAIKRLVDEALSSANLADYFMPKLDYYKSKGQTKYVEYLSAHVKALSAESEQAIQQSFDELATDWVQLAVLVEFLSSLIQRVHHDPNPAPYLDLDVTKAAA